MSRFCNCSKCKKRRKDEEVKINERAMWQNLREMRKLLYLPDGKGNEERDKKGG